LRGKSRGRKRESQQQIKRRNPGAVKSKETGRAGGKLKGKKKKGREEGRTSWPR